MSGDEQLIGIGSCGFRVSGKESSGLEKGEWNKRQRQRLGTLLDAQTDTYRLQDLILGIIFRQCDQRPRPVVATRSET